MLGFLKKVWDKIMNLFTVEGNLSIDTSNVYINGSKSDLSICILCTEEYEHVVIEDKCSNNTLYIVSSDYVNAYGQTIRNVAEPQLSGDAATKGYVDAQVSACLHGITRDEVSAVAS